VIDKLHSVYHAAAFERPDQGQLDRSSRRRRSLRPNAWCRQGAAGSCALLCGAPARPLEGAEKRAVRPEVGTMDAMTVGPLGVDMTSYLLRGDNTCDHV
jgi:hypothetical protein